MGFHDVRLPERFSEGSQFGPGYRTKIIELDSLAEHRVQRGPVAGRRTYALQWSITDLDSLYELYEFYIARQGALNSFRLKDWLDYATTPSGSVHRPDDVAVSHDDEDLVQIGSSLTYQFVKRYDSGPTTVTRNLTTLVDGTVLVGDATGLRSSGFTLDLLNGRVTFDSSPTGQVTGGCQFDVPCRFDQQTDDAFSVAIVALDTGDLPEIKCVEDVSPVVVSQDFPFGGAKNHGNIGANVNLSELEGRFQIFEPTTTGKKAILPNPTDYPLGGPYWFLKNGGSQSMEIETHLGVDVLNPFTAGATRTVWLGLSSAGAKTWYVAS